MKTRLLYLLSIALFSWSCVSECEIPLPTAETENPTPASFMDSVNIDLVSSRPIEFSPWIIFEVVMRKDISLLGHDSTDRLTVNGQPLPFNGSKYRGYIPDLVEEGSYKFMFYHGNDSASFELPVPKFNITSPQSGATVTFWSEENTTVRYSPSNGDLVWAYYSNPSSNESIESQNSYPDNGTYEMIKVVSSGSGSFHLIRGYSDSVSHPTFNSFKYNYATRSKSLSLRWQN